MLPAMENPALRTRLAPMSMKQYHALVNAGELSNDVEFLEGSLVEKMPKTPKHKIIVMKLFNWLRAALPDDYLVQKEDPLTLDNSEPEPDIAIVRGKLDDFSASHPTRAELVIEVAVSSLDVDEAKAEIYAKGGIPEYVIIDAQNQRAIHYSGLLAGKYGEKAIHTGHLPLHFLELSLELDNFLPRK